MIQTIRAMARLHWRTLVLTLALLTLVNVAFLNDKLLEASSTAQVEQSLADTETRFEGEWLLGKGGIRELGGTQLEETGKQKVKLRVTQSRNAELPEPKATTSLALKSTSTAVAAPARNPRRR